MSEQPPLADRGSTTPASPSAAAGSAGPTGEHPDFLAHHFDTPTQQFSASKLGMWLFLAQELLFFGGLFCAYFVYRATHPELFAYGSQFLDKRYGCMNTVVLLVSSLTMALAVNAAQLGQKRRLIALLMATFMGGAIFMGVKYVEYHHKFHEHLVWGAGFYDTPSWAVVARDEGPPGEGGGAALVGDPDHGAGLWQAVCRSCHGVAGEGVEGQGKDMRSYSGTKSDAELIAFLRKGRPISDPENTTKILMPPRGGNPLLTDQDLADIVSFTRTFDVDAAPVTAEPEFFVPQSSIPPPPPGRGDWRKRSRRPRSATTRTTASTRIALPTRISSSRSTSRSRGSTACTSWPGW